MIGSHIPINTHSLCTQNSSLVYVPSQEYSGLVVENPLRVGLVHLYHVLQVRVWAQKVNLKPHLLCETSTVGISFPG